MLARMSFLRRTFAHPFVSAFLGGALVAAAFLVAIGAGWVGDDDDAAGSGTALPSLPAADTGSGDQSAVNEIYEATA